MRLSPVSPQMTNNVVGKALDPVRNSKSDSFLSELKSKIQEVNQLQNLTDQSMAEGSVKGAVNIHETMIQVEEAELSLKLLTRVRDKALTAYNEIMRMQF